MAIFLFFLVPISILGVYHTYYFIPNLGDVIESKKPVFVLPSEQVNENSTLKWLVYESGSIVRAHIEIVFDSKMSMKQLELEDFAASFTVNHVVHEGKTTWFQQGINDDENLTKLSATVEFRKDIPVYHVNDEIVLEVPIAGDKSYFYEIETLHNSETGRSYEDLGVTSTQKGISITAVSHETDDELTVSFVTPPMDLTSVYAYGPYSQALKEGHVGIYLEDATGKNLQIQIIMSLLLIRINLKQRG